MQSLNIKDRILFEFQITQTRQPLSISDGKKCLSSTPVKKVEKNIKRAQNKRCTSSMCEKYEYKGMKTVGVTDYTNYAPPKHFG